MDPVPTSAWASFRRGVLAVLYYIIVSVSLTLFNKALFQRYPVTSPVLVLFSQAIITLFILSILSFLSIPAAFNPALLTFIQHSVHVPHFLSYICMLVFSLSALHQTSLLMYHTLRRMSIVAVLILQAVLLGKVPTRTTLVAAVLIVSGALHAITTNLRLEVPTYALATCANLTNAYYLVRLKDVRDTLELSNLQLLYLNNLYAFPVLLGLLVVLPPDRGVWELFHIPKFLVLYVCSASMALVLNHAVFVNTTVNGAIAHTISAQVKHVLLLGVSILLVDNPLHRSRGMLHGALIALAGSLVYGSGKLMEIFKRRIEELKSSKDVVQILKRRLVRIESEPKCGENCIWD